MAQQINKRNELEQCVMGAALIRGSVDGIDLIPSEFKTPILKQIFETAKNLEEKGTPIDPVTLRANLPEIENIASYIAGLLNVVPTSSNLSYYVEQLKARIYAEESSRLRKEAAKRIAQNDNEEDLENDLRGLVNGLDSLKKRYLPAKKDFRFQNTCYKLLEIIEKAEPIRGVLKFGIPAIDNLLCGAAPGELTIIAARTSVGKTACALHILRNLAFQKITSSFFSLEMSDLPVASRLLAGLSGRNTLLALRYPDQMNPKLREEILKSSGLLIEVSSRIIVHDEPRQNINTILRAASHDVREKNARVLVLDHLQHCKGYSKLPRRDQVSNIAHDFQAICKELNVHGILLSQVLRGSEQEKRAPRLSDLKESSGIEEAADNVFLLHKTPETETLESYQMQIIKAKGRNSGTGASRAIFNKDTQSIEELV